MSIRDRMTLELAGTRYRYRAAKVQVAMRDLGYRNETAYDAAVDRLLDDPDAWREMPEVVARLRRLREARAAVRKAG
jgi:hypothetical protein